MVTTPSFLILPAACLTWPGQRFILLVCSLSIYSRPPTQFPVYTTIALPCMIPNSQGFAKIYKVAYSRGLIGPYSLVSSEVAYSRRYKACDQELILITGCD